MPTTEMNPAAELEQLKRACGEVLAYRGVKLTSKTAAALVHAFWSGVAAQSGNVSPYVVMCLASGRHDRLVTMPE